MTTEDQDLLRAIKRGDYDKKAHELVEMSFLDPSPEVRKSANHRIKLIEKRIVR